MEILVLFAFIGLHSTIFVLSELIKAPLALLTTILCGGIGIFFLLGTEGNWISSGLGIIFLILSFSFFIHNFIYNKYSNKPKLRIISKDSHWRVQRYSFLAWEDIKADGKVVEHDSSRAATEYAKNYNNELPGWKIVKR